MVSLRILAKGSDTAPFGAVSALLQKDAEKLSYKIHRDFSTSVNKWEPYIIFERATDFAAKIAADSDSRY